MTSTLAPTETPNNIVEGSITIPDETLDDKGGTQIDAPGKQGEETTPNPEDQDMFPRDVVEKLRRENAAARTKAKDRDALAQRLHRVLVEQTGRLADATDLPEVVTISIEGREAGDHVYAPDVQVPAGATLQLEDDIVIATVSEVVEQDLGDESVQEEQAAESAED